MRYKVILDDLKCKIFFVPQPTPNFLCPQPWLKGKCPTATIFVISIPEAPSIYSHRALTLLTPG